MEQVNLNSSVIGSLGPTPKVGSGHTVCHADFPRNAGKQYECHAFYCERILVYWPGTNARRQLCGPVPTEPEFPWSSWEVMYVMVSLL